MENHPSDPLPASPRDAAPASATSPRRPNAAWRWLRRLASLPLDWAGQAARVFHLPAAVPLLQAAWVVSGDGWVGRAALAARMQRDGVAAMLAEADAGLARRPSALVAAFAAAVATDVGALAAARRYAELAHGLGDDPSGMLDGVDYLLAVEAQPDRREELVAELDERHDLPPGLAQIVARVRLWQALRQGRFDEARRRAQRMVEVDPEPPALMALWAVAEHEGRTGDANRYLRQAAAFPLPARLLWAGLAHAALGRWEQVRAIQEHLAEVGSDAAADLAEGLAHWEQPA